MRHMCAAAVVVAEGRKCGQTGNQDGQNWAVMALLMLCQHMPHTALLCYQFTRDSGVQPTRRAPCSGLAFGEALSDGASDGKWAPALYGALHVPGCYSSLQFTRDLEF